MERCRREAGDKVARRRWGGARGGVDAGRLRSCWSLDLVRAWPVKVYHGSGQAKGHRRRGITVADKFTQGGVRAKFRRCRDWGWGRRPRGDSWNRGEAPSAVGEGLEAVERRCTAVQGLGAAELRERAELGLRAAAVRRDGGKGSAGALLIGRRPTWACVPGLEGRRDPRRGSRLRLRGGGRRIWQVGPAWQWARAGRALRAGEAELRRGRGETGRAQREKAAGRAGPV